MQLNTTQTRKKNNLKRETKLKPHPRLIQFVKYQQWLEKMTEIENRKDNTKRMYNNCQSYASMMWKVSERSEAITDRGSSEIAEKQQSNRNRHHRSKTADA